MRLSLGSCRIRSFSFLWFIFDDQINRCYGHINIRHQQQSVSTNSTKTPISLHDLSLHRTVNVLQTVMKGFHTCWQMSFSSGYPIKSLVFMGSFLNTEPSARENIHIVINTEIINPNNIVLYCFIQTLFI